MAETFKTELHAMQQLLIRQSQLLRGPQLAKLVSTQANAFVVRAGALRGIECGVVSELTTLIQDGPWTSDQQSDLIMALSSAMDGNRAAITPDRRKGQILQYFCNYTTAKDNDVFNDVKQPLTVKISVGLDICDRIHARLLKETSKRDVLSTICALHEKPSGWRAKELRSWYLHFKSEYNARFKINATDPSIGHIEQYPEKPSMLPDDKYTIMYKDADAVGIEVPQDVKSKIHSAIWCRGNAVALRDDNDIIVSGSELGRPR